MKTRSGGVVKPSPVSALVANAIANVKKHLRAEYLKAKRAADVTRAAERLKHLQKRDVVQLAALRRKDAEAVEKLLEVGVCPVRLKLRPLFPYVRNDLASLKEKRKAMHSTTWAFCAKCHAATEGRDGWHNPFGTVPWCVHNGRPERSGEPFAYRFLEDLLPLTEYLPDPPDANLYHKLLKKEPRLMLPRLGARVVAPSPSPALPEPADALDEPPPPPPPTFPKCQRMLCTMPPTPDHVLTSTNVICKVTERDYNLETPLKRALRQRAHSHKHALGMNDVIFYKHMRDHNLEPDEAHAEVLRRKRLIHAGSGSSYEPPEMGHLVLGLLDGVPVDDPTPPPPSPPDLWRAFLKQRANQRELDNSGIVERLRAF